MAQIIKTDGSIKEVDLSLGDCLANLQEAVGGYIELIGLGKGRVMVVNEDGKAKGLQPNIQATEIVKDILPDEVIVGNVVIADKKEIE